MSPFSPLLLTPPSLGINLSSCHRHKCLLPFRGPRTCLSTRGCREYSRDVVVGQRPFVVPHRQTEVRRGLRRRPGTPRTNGHYTSDLYVPNYRGSLGVRTPHLNPPSHGVGGTGVRPTKFRHEGRQRVSQGFPATRGERGSKSST